MTMLRRSKTRWAAAALMALVVLLLGALAHYQHHLLDPDCDPGRTGETHACSCASFHAGALAESIVSGTPRVLPQPFDRLPSDTPAPDLAERGVCPNRGPPSA
jgi:hypothetical protein